MYFSVHYWAMVRIARLVGNFTGLPGNLALHASYKECSTQNLVVVFFYIFPGVHDLLHHLCHLLAQTDL